MKKNFSRVIILATLVILLVGCGTENSATTSTEEQPYLGEWRGSYMLFGDDETITECSAILRKDETCTIKNDVVHSEFTVNYILLSSIDEFYQITLTDDPFAFYYDDTLDELYCAGDSGIGAFRRVN